MTHTPSSAVAPVARPGHPTRTSRYRRPRLSPDLLTELAHRLTARDRWLLQMLHEHRVLTSTQITQLAFGSEIRARHRLLRLWRLRAIDRQQPLVERGTAPMHYILGDAGAAVLAALHGISVKELGYARDRAVGVLHSSRLTHTVGVNGILTALVAHARAHADTELAAWWPERRCAQHWGDLARPDAHGKWRQGDLSVPFFLEYDTGTEPLHRLTAKLHDYADLTHVTGVKTPVLFWFHSPAREANAHKALPDGPVPIATAAPIGDEADPAGPLWLTVDTNVHDRRQLADLHVLAPPDPAHLAPSPVTPPDEPAWTAPVYPMPPNTRSLASASRVGSLDGPRPAR